MPYDVRTKMARSVYTKKTRMKKLAAPPPKKNQRNIGWGLYSGNPSGSKMKPWNSQKLPYFK